MKASLEDISPVKKKLLIEIEAKEVDRQLDRAYRDLGKKAKIPGFRPGKAPRSMLERHFGSEVAEDVTRNIINDSFPKALEEVKTFPVGAPLLEKETLKQGQSFAYSAVMEVRPQFEVKDYLGREVEKEILSVSDEDVQNRLEQIRVSNGKLSSIDNGRPIQKDDYVVLDYEAFEGEVPLDDIKATNFLIKVGSRDFHPDFEKALLGLQKGEKKEIDVHFEEEYYHSKLAGKHVRFQVMIQDIKEMVLPDLDDAFAKNLGAGFEAIKDLEEKLKESIIERETKRIHRDVKRRLLESIGDGLDFELPRTMVESEIESAIENVKQDLIRRGSSLEKMGLTEAKLRDNFRPTSEKRVKEVLILGQIADQDNIEIGEDEMEKGFRDLAAATGQDAEVLRKYYEARDLMGIMRDKLMEEKTLNYLMEHAKMRELPKDKLSENKAEKEND